MAASELELPDEAHVVFYYRNDHFHLADPDTHLKKGDEMVILTHSRHLEELRQRWSPNNAA